MGVIGGFFVVVIGGTVLLISCRKTKIGKELFQAIAPDSYAKIKKADDDLERAQQELAETINNNKMAVEYHAQQMEKKQKEHQQNMVELSRKHEEESRRNDEMRRQKRAQIEEELETLRKTNEEFEQKMKDLNERRHKFEEEKKLKKEHEAKN